MLRKQIRLSESGWSEDYKQILLDTITDKYLNIPEDLVVVEVTYDFDIQQFRSTVAEDVFAYWEIHDLQRAAAMIPVFEETDWDQYRCQLPPLIVDSESSQLLDGFHRSTCLLMRFTSPTWVVVDIAKQPHLLELYLTEDAIECKSDTVL